jgi:hypothetical protein
MKLKSLLSLGQVLFLIAFIHGPICLANAKITSQLPAKKQPKKKSTRIDFTESEGVVIAPQNFSSTKSLNQAIDKAKTDQRLQEEVIQSRTFAPAPPGDLAELSYDTVPEKLAPMTPLVTANKPPMLSSDRSGSEMLNFELRPPANSSSEVQSETVTRIYEKTPVLKVRPLRSAFFRTGYLNATYRDFDSRMKDGATSIGLGAGQVFKTEYGEIEARASFDVYHALDQSLTIDNIRMFATRTEVAYWFTQSRVRPALSVGLGWADYAVKSYRLLKSDTEGEVVTLRTHAKSQAFTLIAGSIVRVQLNDEVFLDAQTEFLAILGGNNAKSVQGLALNLNFGWIF